MLLVVAMIVATFLIAVSGICGGIEVQKDLLRSAVPAPLCEVELKEDFGYPVARASCGRILRPADGRLAGEICSISGKEPHTTLSKGSSRRALESFWSPYPQALWYKRCLTRANRVESSSRSPLGYALRDAFRQAHLGVHLRQPAQPSIGGEPAAVEGGFQHQGTWRFKTDLRCGAIAHKGALPPLASFGATTAFTIMIGPASGSRSGQRNHERPWR
jgi:hypothetical protein